MQERTFAAHRPGSTTMILRLSFFSLALGLLAACGGGDGGAALPVDDPAVEDSPAEGATDEKVLSYWRR